MEARRLAVISSHLSQTRPQHRQPPVISPSACCAAEGPVPEEDGGRKDCVFCKIIRGDSPAFKLYEDDICLCILDSNPLSYGWFFCRHSLVIPKSHFPALEATPSLVVAAMCSKVPFLSNAIMKATQCDSFNLLVNSGSAAGQVIFHTHFHIIPRKAGDQLWPSESFRRQPIKGDPETVGLVDCIRGQISSLSGDNCNVQEFILGRI